MRISDWSSDVCSSDLLSLEVAAGECVALYGPSGSGKSTLLRSLYANYKPGSGHVWVRHADDSGSDWVDMAGAPPHQVLEVRRRTVGYVSPFLRVIPRVSARDIVAEPLHALGVPLEEARGRGEALLDRPQIGRTAGREQGEKYRVERGG